MRYHIFVRNTKKRTVPKRPTIVTKIISKEEANEIREYDDD